LSEFVGIRQTARRNTYDVTMSTIWSTSLEDNVSRACLPTLR
jgi:hypothetical protein